MADGGKKLLDIIYCRELSENKTFFLLGWSLFPLYYQVNSDRDSGSGLKHMWKEEEKNIEDNESKLKEGTKTIEKQKK